MSGFFLRRPVQPIYTIMDVLSLGAASFRDWPTAPFRRASPNFGRLRAYPGKFVVLYTFYCVVWFNKFEQPLSA